MRQPFDGNAKWIWSKEGLFDVQERKDPYRTRYFRRTFEIKNKDPKLTLHITCDSRYILWINGKQINRGPAKGDIAHHFFDSIDVSSFLVKGKNVIAVQVKYYGDVLPYLPFTGAPHSIMTAAPCFVCDALLDDGGAEILLHSNKDWMVLCDEAYSHKHCTNHPRFTGYREIFDSSKYSWGWQEADYGDCGWESATELFPAEFSDSLGNSYLPHRLTPRIVALLEEKPKRFCEAFGSDENTNILWGSLIKDDKELIVPANSKIDVTLDHKELSTGFPVLQVCGGKFSKIIIGYSESLFEKDADTSLGLPAFTEKKLNRNDRNGVVRGPWDEYLPSGKSETYKPFELSGFRFVRIIIETKDEPLTIKKLYFDFCAYPFNLIAEFESDEKKFPKMLDISLRTARLCAHETYEDCPTYEQTQYSGDSQVQALISYYLFGNTALARQALRLFNWSSLPNGLNQSRYPCLITQIIPFWSLHYIMMAHDYWRYTGDLDELRDKLENLISITNWFRTFIGKLPYWCVADWSIDWTDSKDGFGVPPGTTKGLSAMVNFMFIACVMMVADLLDAFGQGYQANSFRNLAIKFSKLCQDEFWDEKEGLFKDSPLYPDFSQLTNAWAILSRVATPQQAKRIAQRLENFEGLDRAGYFGMFYVFRALSLAGEYDRVFRMFGPWEKMMDLGLTTWGEAESVMRSDCHAWSCAPAFEFFAEILGVKPLTPGYSKVLIEPRIGNLNFAKGKVPIPSLNPEKAEFIEIAWIKNGDKLLVEGSIPENRQGLIVNGNNQIKVVGAFKTTFKLPK